MIGSAADASGASGVNQVVIGQGTTGQADNSVTLGNTSVTDVYMNQDGFAKVNAGAMHISSSTANYSSTSASLHIEGSGSSVVEVDGTLGRLFTVTDELSGSIFSANTIAGIPVIEATSAYEVKLDPFGNGRTLIGGTNLDYRVGIGTHTPSEPFHVLADRGGEYVARFQNDGDNANRFGIVIQAGADDGSGTTNYILFEDGNGDDIGVASNDSGTFSVSDLSDARKKKNIRDTKVKGLDSINAIKVRDFEWINNDMSVNAGLVAQELEEVFPDAVTEFGDDDLLAVSRERLVPVLIKAVQELSEKVESQQEEIKELKKNI